MLTWGVTKLLQPLPINWTNKKDWLLQWARDEERSFIHLIDSGVNSWFLLGQIGADAGACLVTTNKAEAPDYLRFFLRFWTGGIGSLN